MMPLSSLFMKEGYELGMLKRSLGLMQPVNTGFVYNEATLS